MNPELLTTENGLILGMAYVIVHLYRENTGLREKMLDMLEKYQNRDEEERKWRVENERKRMESLQ